MSCCNLNKEAQCAKFSTAHGPGTKVCDQFLDEKCGLFQELYHGQPKPSPSCFNNQVGKEYICPQVGPGGVSTQPLGNWFQSQQGDRKYTCFHQNPNIGVHELCPYQYTPKSEKQEGGSRKNKNKGHKYRSMKTQVKGKRSWKKNMSGGGSGEEGEAATKVKGLCPCDKGYCRQTFGPDYYNLAALGLQGNVYRPTPTPLLGYGYGVYPACPYNPTCCCGPNCPCGPSCCCGQTNKFKPLAPPALNGEGNQSGGGVGCPSEGVNKYNCAVSSKVLDPPYTCDTKQCIMGEDGCPTFDSTCKPQTNYEFICGNKTRCGNGEIGDQPGCGCNCKEYIPKIWNQPINPYRTYGINQPEEVPGYYLDVSQPPIGQRPVRVQSNREAIPSMLLVNNTNLPGRCFDCHQPCWNDRCL